MAWDVRSTYYYLVCFATLLMMIIGGVQIVRSGIDLAFPEAYYTPSPIEIEERMSGRPGTQRTPEQIAEMARVESERVRRQERQRELRNLFGNLALLAIATPVYVYHWRRVRRTEE